MLGANRQMKQTPVLFQWGHNSAGDSSCENTTGETMSYVVWWQPKIISFQPNSVAPLKHRFQAWIIAFHKTVEIQFTMNFKDRACMHKEKYLPLQTLATLSFHGLFTNSWILIFLAFNYILPSLCNSKYRLFMRHLDLTYFCVAVPHFTYSFRICKLFKMEKRF